MKKIIVVILSVLLLVLLISSFTSCNNSNGDRNNFEPFDSSGNNASNSSGNQSTENNTNQSDENSNTRPASQGLSYQKGSNGITITGIGSCKDREVVIPKKIEGSYVVRIAQNAFKETDIVSITIPETITSVGEDAFYDCYELKKVYIENLSKWCEISFEIIGHVTYSNPMSCGADLYLNGNIVRELIIPDGIKTVKPYTFYGCKSIVKLIIPDSVETISTGAFSECTNLVSIEFGTSVRDIFVSGDGMSAIWAGEKAFHGCHPVEIINHSSLPISDHYRYEDIVEYAKLVHEGESKVLIEDDFVFFSYRNVTYLVKYLGDEYSLILPDDYKGNSYGIAAGALYNDNIVSLTIPQSITTIENASISSQYLVEIVNNSSATITGTNAKEIHSGDSRLINYNDYLLYTTDNDIVYLVKHIGDKTSIILDREIEDREYKIDYLFLVSIKNCTVYYTGTFDEWNKMYYQELENIYYYSESEPTDLKNYWHYVNGAPTIWE